MSAAEPPQGANSAPPGQRSGDSRNRGDQTTVPVIARVQVHLFRAPVAVAVAIAFGAMHDRPMVLVRIEDSDGIAGWGEVWCDFPLVGAEHRARLITSVFAPLLIGDPAGDPAAHFARLNTRVASQVLRTGEPGPFAQCMAAIDQALTDMTARRAKLPLWRHLGGTTGKIPVYASGLGPEAIDTMATQHWHDGFRAFKLKVGFGRERVCDGCVVLPA